MNTRMSLPGAWRQHFTWSRRLGGHTSSPLRPRRPHTSRQSRSQGDGQDLNTEQGPSYRKRAGGRQTPHSTSGTLLWGSMVVASHNFADHRVQAE